MVSHDTRESAGDMDGDRPPTVGEPSVDSGGLCASAGNISFRTTTRFRTLDNKLKRLLAAWQNNAHAADQPFQDQKQYEQLMP